MSGCVNISIDQPYLNGTNNNSFVNYSVGLTCLDVGSSSDLVMINPGGNRLYTNDSLTVCYNSVNVTGIFNCSHYNVTVVVSRLVHLYIHVLICVTINKKIFNINFLPFCLTVKLNTLPKNRHRCICDWPPQVVQ